jgi:hypothetical protein
MFSKKLFFALMLISTTAFAQTCPETVISAKALHAAQVMESLNGPAAPLVKRELHSLSSAFDTYIAIFMYPQSKSYWRVKVQSAACEIESVSRAR